jgi:uncharacterized membrane protein
MNLNEKVQQLTTEGYEFKFGQYLSDGYEYFKAQAGLFIGFFVLSMIMIITGSFIPLVGSIASQILSVTFYVGYFIVCNKIKLGNTVSFDDFFKGFSSIGQIAIIQLILTGFSLLIFMPLLIFGFTVFFSGLFGAIKSDSFQEPQSPEELLALFNVDGLIPLILITIILLMFMQTIYSFAAANAHFFKVGAWEAMEASRKIIQKRFFQFFALILAVALINILGILCLFVGLLVTVPMSYAIFYAAFDDIMKPNDEHLITEDHSFESRSN